MGKKVIVAGHVCLDITPTFPVTGKKQISGILMPGKLIETGGVSVSTGGAVANTGLALKIFGADVRLMGKIGDDEFGDMIRSIMERSGAGADLIRAENETSSYSVVIAVPGIDRIFLHCPGTNNTFKASDIPDDTLEDTALFHFGYPPLMKEMYVNSGAELVSLFKKVKAKGCVTSLDLAMVDPDSEAGKADWKEILRRVLPLTDIFVPSIEELCFMIDRYRFNDWQKKAGEGDITEFLDPDNDIRPLADMCMDMGCKILMLKCGMPGLFLKTGSREVLKSFPERGGLDQSIWADTEFFERSYKADAVLSGTGAGDTSIAAFLASLLEGAGPRECVRLAAATGASCVSAYDALSGLKPLNELRDRINSGWDKN